MAKSTKTVWPLKPHTRAKHEILRRYLEAWSAILGAGFKTIAYVDGFAGPGIYEGGEDGSPIIALKAALAHRDRISGRALFLFIERDHRRAEVLQERVRSLALPKDKLGVKIISGRTFEEGFRQELIDWYRDRNKPLPPTFAFIDPFGWTGVPFALVKEILSNKSCEVLINFMYEDINRHILHGAQVGNFDELFGTEEWRDIDRIKDPRERCRFLHALYGRQLRDFARARYVRSFEMRNEKNATDYFLFFATNSPKGMEKMKEAMWKADESGEFRFSDATNPAQALLFTPAPNFAELRRLIVDRFAGQVVTVAQVEDFVLADTPFKTTHYKKQVLAELETEGMIEAVNAPPERRPRTYRDPQLQLRFAGSAA